MKSVIYIDHIKPAPEGEHKEVESILQNLLNPNQFGILISLSNDITMGAMVRINKIDDQFQMSHAVLVHLDEYKLIKCTIKFKQ